MALVWFVDKSPRSRKPVQYRRLDDFTSYVQPMPEWAAENDLLPVLLPCALCCAQQQLTASLAAHQLQQKTLTPPQTETSQYSEFLSLCQHVECLVEKSMARMNGDCANKKEDTTKKSIDDDMRLRSLRDSNRKPIMKPLQHQTSTTTNNHYLWKNEHSSRDDKYKSRFNPMRNW